MGVSLESISLRVGLGRSVRLFSNVQKFIVLKLKSWIFLSCSLSIYIFLKIIMKISFNVIGAILKNFHFRIYRENVKELPVESPQRGCVVEVLEKCQRYHFFPVFVFHLFIY